MRELQHTERLLESYLGDWAADPDTLLRLRYGGLDQSDGFFIPLSVVSDRQGGRNWPLWRTEPELAALRQRSRIACQTNAYAEGLLRNLCSFAVGGGFKYEVTSKEKLPDADPSQPGHQDPEWLEQSIAQAQDVVDQFLKINRWHGVSDYRETGAITESREHESCRRLFRDGDTILRLFHLHDGSTRVRFVEPEQVFQPAGYTETDGWSFGIQHAVEPFVDVEDIQAYHVGYQTGMATPGALSLHDDPARTVNGEIVPAQEIIHLKAPGTDSAVKRGIPLFSYDVLDALERATKLQRNASIGAAIRAATAEIWQHNYGTQQQISNLMSGLKETTREDPITGRSENVERIRPGTVRRIPGGQQLIQPAADNTGSYLTGVQGDLRQAATAFAAPEYLASGDASNGNYASLREAGTPFVRFIEAIQSLLKAAFMRAVWLALKHAAASGHIDPRALDQLDLQCVPPNVVMRDELQKAQEDQILIQLGVKDRKSAAMDRGLDWDEVQASNAEYQEHNGQQGGALPGMDDGGMGGGPDGGMGGGGMGGGAGPVPRPFESSADADDDGTESVRESKDDSGHEHGDDGKFTSGSGGGRKIRPGADAHTHFQKLAAAHNSARGLQNRDHARAELSAAYDALDAPEYAHGTDPMKPLTPDRSFWVHRHGVIRSASAAKTLIGVDPQAADLDAQLQARTEQARQEAAKLPSDLDALKTDSRIRGNAGHNLMDRLGKPDGRDFSRRDGTESPYWVLPSGHALMRDSGKHPLVIPREKVPRKLKELPADFEKLKKAVGGPRRLARIVLGHEPERIETKQHSLDVWELPGGHAAVAVAGASEEELADSLKLLSAEKVQTLRNRAVRESVVLGDPAELCSLLEAGFSGVITDKLGRKRHYIDGKPVSDLRFDMDGSEFRRQQSSAHRQGKEWEKSADQLRAEAKAIQFTPEQDAFLDRVFGSGFGESVKSMSDTDRLRHSHAMYKVTERLPPKVIKRLLKHVHKAHAVATVEEATAAWQEGGGEKGRSVVGFYDPSSGLVLSDGIHSAIADTDSARHVWAHELGHAIDGPEFELSSSAEWHAAFQAEIADKQLSNYAATEPVEGFAEFCRAVYGSDVEHAEIARHFPQCTKFFKRRGLL